jgi:membrane protein CcdC involved in cytochrome C biogenesis
MFGKPGGFFNRNAVTIVMVPALILIHWGWYKVQDNEVFVKKEEKEDLPVVLVSF